jgi:TonB family protein
MCLTAGGVISGIRTISSSGFPAYDRKIRSKMRLWRYRPYRVNGKPVPICTVVTFVYKQAG